MPDTSLNLRVALTMRIVQTVGYTEPRDAISHDWIDRLRMWRMNPLLVPNGLYDPGDYLEMLRPDILVLTGGDDLEPESRRDRTESTLAQVAMDSGIPILGVCRGMQLLNDMLGGTNVAVDGHVNQDHAVTFQPIWQDVFGGETKVNSYHGTGISPQGLASVLEPAALDEDGFIEAFVHVSQPIAAVMWHPERDGVEFDQGRRIFSWLLEHGKLVR